MIPKIIHYCWFGKKEEPKEVRRCISSWRKHCPDYVIRRWDESNFNFEVNTYAKEAYSVKKWAFVSDFARLKIIYDQGGIYLDTDVELIKSLDDILDNEFFFGIEKDTNLLTYEESFFVNTGLGFGAEKSNEIVKALLNSYDCIHFINNEIYDLTTCPDRNTNTLREFGYQSKNEIQKFRGGTVYPAEYFCPLECSSNINNFTGNTISIHHFSAMWKSSSEKLLYKIKIFRRVLMKKIMGNKKNHENT